MPEPFQPDDTPPGSTPDANDSGSGGPRLSPPGPASPLSAAPLPGADLEGPRPALRQLDPRWVIAERISGAIGAGALSTGALVAVLIFGSRWRALGVGGWLVLSITLFAGAMIAPALQYRRARYRVTPFGIEIRWGVWWRRVTIVPRSRIQHTDVEQGPLLRRFGLAKLVMHTAGTEHSTVPLYGLAMPDATAIRDDLMRRGGAAAGGAESAGGARGADDGI